MKNETWSRGSVKSHYTQKKVARGYDRQRFSGKGGRHIDYMEKKIVSELVSGLDSPKKKGRTKRKPVVLDLATGSGRFAVMLAKKGYKVFAFDYSEEMLDIVREKCRAEGLKAGKDIVLVRGDARKLPFRQGTFDAAVSMRFLWHYRDYKKLIGGVMKVLKKDGFFVFDLFNLYSLRFIYTWIANLKVYVKLTTRKSLKRFAVKKGYKIESDRYYFFFPYLFYRFCPDFLAGIMIWKENLIQKTPLRRLSSAMYFKLRKR